ncbi:MAG: hypothetical protein AB8B58_05220 [Roseobacter sp.]
MDDDLVADAPMPPEIVETLETVAALHDTPPEPPAEDVDVASDVGETVASTEGAPAPPDLEHEAEPTLSDGAPLPPEVDDGTTVEAAADAAEVPMPPSDGDGTPSGDPMPPEH